MTRPSTESQPRAVDWDHAPYTEVRPGIFGATMHTPQLTVVFYRYAPGSRWEEHSHPQDQVTTVIAGAVDFWVDGRHVRLAEGQTALIPGGVPHSAVVEEDSGARTINVLTRRDEAPRRV